LLTGGAIDGIISDSELILSLLVAIEVIESDGRALRMGDYV